MVNIPSRPEIITVNSEELQPQVRDLLPSQAGFGSELQASNVITPIIDLTRTAEGSTLPIELQEAIAFGSQTPFNVSNTTATITSGTGFFRVFGYCARPQNATNAFNIRMTMTDGVSPKVILDLSTIAIGYNQLDTIPFDFIIFLAPGESLTATTDNVSAFWAGSTRQVATGDGEFVDPSGFPV